MRYTFGQAKRLLAPYASAIGMLDVGAAVNTAIDELSRTRTWARMRKLVRFTIDGENFALPQDCGAIIRAAVDYVPVSVRSTEYEFLSSGPGDLDQFAETGYAPMHGIQRTGVYPTAYSPAAALPLAAFATAAPTGPLRVRGMNADGEKIVATVPVNVWTGYDDADTVDLDAISKTAWSFLEIDSVTVPDDGSAYISLFSVGDSLAALARFHPKVAIPEFTRYRMPGFSGTAGTTYRMLAEVHQKVLPLVDDDEVVPFDSLLPVQYMMTAITKMEAGEVETADKYRERAALMLVGREENELERQAPIVVNKLLEFSSGSVSDDWANI